SSGIFVAWGGVALGLILERFWKNGIGAAAAGLCGFLSLLVALLLATLVPAHGLEAASWDSRVFGEIPVQSGGRVQPIETLASGSLLQMRARRELALSGPERIAFGRKPSAWSPEERSEIFRVLPGLKDNKAVLDALEVRPLPIKGGALGSVDWLIEVAFRAHVARHLPTFRVDHPAVLRMAGRDPELTKFVSWDDVLKHSKAISEAADKARNRPQADRDAEDRAIIQLETAARQYAALSMAYFVALLAVLIYWATGKDGLRRWGAVALWVLFALHTAALLYRMWLHGRPPVTNLYSSGIFVAWGGVALGLILERFWKNGIGAAAAGLCGFLSLLVAHNLGLSGEDNLESVRAVLDSNFWLATHVTIVTLGYSATFVAGILGGLHLILRALKADYAAGDSVSRAAYGILAFATLASFVGTMLGGIWADQSWGRFWGWDPKENGAVLIVLWCAVCLHARWGGLVRREGLMQLLVFGNIVTAWSWFGTNLLGVGLHSYGFTESGFFWLYLVFMPSQLALIALGWLPARARPAATPA
ncbi:MAG: cytochrome c biogenesis protein, partial [Opitutia bacterium]